MTIDNLEMIDWAERYPHESSLQLVIRQSTFCPCGRAKAIGQPNCGADYHTQEDEMERARR